MSEEVFRCLYAETLNNKTIDVEIERVREAPEMLYCNGKSTGAWDVIFKQRDKEGRTIYIQIPKPNAHGKSTTILRQFMMVTGKEPCQECAGIKLRLHPVESKKAPTGQALRIKLN